MVKIAPSILSADFSKLGDEIRDVIHGGADLIHVDVMDGHFVPNITMGPLVVRSIRPITTLPIDVHLMIENPDNYIPAFAESGADMISVHVETCPHLHRTIQLIKDHGIQAGVVLNPATPLSTIEPILVELDFVLLMTVNPGFGGQAFIPSVVSKIQQLRQILQQRKLHPIRIEVDGGITPETAPLTVQAGADMLVAGNAIFGQTDRKLAIRKLREATDVSTN